LPQAWQNDAASIAPHDQQGRVPGGADVAAIAVREEFVILITHKLARVQAQGADVLGGDGRATRLKSSQRIRHG
jgi:hypothetical protein